MTLPAQDRAVLAFEHAGWWKNRGAKDTAVLVLFGMSWPAYGQTLHSILDKPEALEYDAEYVRRLRRLRDARRADRPSRAIGFQIT